MKKLAPCIVTTFALVALTLAGCMQYEHRDPTKEYKQHMHDAMVTETLVGKRIVAKMRYETLIPNSGLLVAEDGLSILVGPVTFVQFDVGSICYSDGWKYRP